MGMGTVTAIITISNPYPFLNKKTSYNKRVKFMKRKKLMKFPREQKESGSVGAPKVEKMNKRKATRLYYIEKTDNKMTQPPCFDHV